MSPALRRVLHAATTSLLVAVVVAASGSATAVTPQLAAFEGGYRTDCDLPTEPGTGEPASGGYTCEHSSTSTFCEFKVPNGPVLVGHHETCEAHLLDSSTSGTAEYDGGGYRCVNGYGTGTVEYVQDNSGPPIYIPVTLQVQGAVITITGSYVRAGTSEVIEYHASIPAQCATRVRQPAGYAGTVTAI